MSTPARTPVLEGRKALVVGIANEHSIAWGCASAFRQLGADIAVTYLNDKAKPHVEPLANEVGASLLLPLDVSRPGEAVPAAGSTQKVPPQLSPTFDPRAAATSPNGACNARSIGGPAPTSAAATRPAIRVYSMVVKGRLPASQSAHPAASMVDAALRLACARRLG